MNEFVKIIITNAVALVVKALNFIPNLTKEEFDAAVDEATAQLQTAKAEFSEAKTEDVLTVAASMVDNGLEITKAALDAAGKHEADKWLDMAEAIVVNLETNNGHPIAAAIKAWFQKTFQKKA